MELLARGRVGASGRGRELALWSVIAAAIGAGVHDRRRLRLPKVEMLS